MKPSVSTNNLSTDPSSSGNEDFALRLGTRLNMLKSRNEAYDLIEEDFEELCDQCKNAEEFFNNLDNKISKGSIFFLFRTRNSIKIFRDIEDCSKEEDSEETIITDLKIKTKNTKISEEKEKNNEEDDSPRSNKTLTPKEKVRMWLPVAEALSNNPEDDLAKPRELSKLDDPNLKESSDYPAEEDAFNQSFETVIHISK